MIKRVREDAIGVTYGRVGLFGAYGIQNFGDDLMAVMFGKSLQDLGVSFTVYGFDLQAGERYGFSVSSSASELVRLSDVIVVGGGGFLLPHRGKSNHWESELEVLLKTCNDLSIPILCFSIGGAGLPFEELRPLGRRHLIERAKYCTLRLRSELPLIANAGTAGAQYEDVVWMTPLFFPLPGDKLQTRKRPVIGISMYPIGAVYRKLHLVFFSLLARVRSDCDFVFFEVKFASEGKKVNQALRPKRALTLPNCRFYKFTSVEDGIQFLSSLDLLLTSRLHILITALSYRIPCISLLPRPKTVMYLQETGLDRFCWTRKRLWKLIYLLIPPLFKGLLRSVKPLDPISFQRSAAFHFRDLERNLRDLGVLQEKTNSAYPSVDVLKS